ncbi:MAG: sulfate adenylyltransferase [Alphaproteobacteria bacterium]|nr:sulfate adenylyltransferase [Alphaproteobacteria bacterium]
MSEFALSRSQYLELEKLALGVFQPLPGFMNEDEFRGVVSRMRLPDGAPFPLPVVLDVDAETAARMRGRPAVTLTYEGEEVGRVAPESIFTCDKDSVARQVFGTDDSAHPGVEFFYRGGDHFVGGPVMLTRRVELDVNKDEMTPAETRAEFARRGWKTVVGFQTRNVPHRAHEYLQRVALEVADGLFIQPLIGRKKKGDYTPAAIIAGYRTLIGRFLPAARVLLGALTTNMRYAGPREAVFHAIIRRNYGCTHFIVGRDHAGVGNYYGLYDAHRMVETFGDELGIDVLRLAGPYYCSICDGIATERTCPHETTAPHAVRHISGTDIRATLLGGAKPDPRLFRPEVLDAVRGMQLFIDVTE